VNEKRHLDVEQVWRRLFGAVFTVKMPAPRTQAAVFQRAGRRQPTIGEQVAGNTYPIRLSNWKTERVSTIT